MKKFLLLFCMAPALCFGQNLKGCFAGVCDSATANYFTILGCKEITIMKDGKETGDYRCLGFTFEGHLGGKIIEIEVRGGKIPVDMREAMQKMNWDDKVVLRKMRARDQNDTNYDLPRVVLVVRK